MYIKKGLEKNSYICDITEPQSVCAIKRSNFQLTQK